MAGPSRRAAAKPAADKVVKKAPARKASASFKAAAKPAAKKTSRAAAPKEPVEPESESDDEALKPTKKAAPKKATLKKAAPKKAAAAAKATAKKAVTATISKRTRDATEDEAPPAKRARSESEAPSQKSGTSRGSHAAKTRQPVVVHKWPKFVKLGAMINEAPTTPLDIFVMGSGESGELGLGNKVYNIKLKPTNVKRPRINHNLGRHQVGVVSIAAGGMHAAVLTRDNTILTWGVNDQRALGRDTAWDGGLRDMDAGDDSSDDSSMQEDGSSMNPHESTPGLVDSEYFLPGTKFVQVVASDSATFALTADGRVYGWGTFRANNGILGFEEHNLVQQTPKILKALHKIKKLAAGDNHILALDSKGKVWAWGDGEQQQLGRRVQERVRETALIPTAVGVRHVVDVACGRNHSFAIDKNGQVWAWGANNFGQCGILDRAGEENAFVFSPTKVEIFPEGKKINAVAGGNHHSVACTEDGLLLSWGRIDGSMVGFSSAQIKAMNNNNLILDDRGNPRILKLAVPHDEPTNTRAVFAGTDNSFALTEDGKSYAFGFSTAYQTGLGTDEDVATPTLVANTAVKNHKIMWAGCGGQFSILAGVPNDDQTSSAGATNGSTTINGNAAHTNGVNGTT
ncbi:hypothetical protein MKZ38_004555 [Zalerion maritima]|uniref:RCC1-like domain-containing protein n=1 Tax=Zalerion maritima TaxID=339359 RepID=A0AAD5WPT4_9PEZI|nr:hypothetical protein MKZ38_004555 [Zalerion maritima]